jgi:hypothetical protein
LALRVVDFHDRAERSSAVDPVWVQCSLCNKWRLPGGETEYGGDAEFECSMASGASAGACDALQQLPTADEARALAGWSTIRRIVNSKWLLPLPSSWAVARVLLRIYAGEGGGAVPASVDTAAAALEAADRALEIAARARALQQAQADLTAAREPEDTPSTDM